MSSFLQCLSLDSLLQGGGVRPSESTSSGSRVRLDLPSMFVVGRVALMVTDRRPHAVSTTEMFFMLAAVLHLGERTDPVNQTSVAHTVTAAGTCTQLGAGLCRDSRMIRAT